MSAFAIIFERSDAQVDSGTLDGVMARLRHRGPDGSDVYLAKRFSMGHWHFWTTPEEVGERQPLKVDGLPFRIVLDGRLDNRSEILSRLNLDSDSEGLPSDADLILRAYARWGKDCVEKFVGDFAFVIVDEREHELFCARDALGERTLFYSAHGTRVVIASEPWAVAGADTSAGMNENAAVHFFALRATPDGQTWFKDVYELLPAHGMTVRAGGVQTWRYWRPDPTVRLRGRSDGEYAQKFLSLLEESVRCRMRSAAPVGILMSGGLDSGSMACLAARMIAPTPLTTVSYVFDELTDCDERSYIQTVQDRWGVRSVQVPCDDAWPFRDWENWPRDPNHPEGNAYRLLKQRAYRRASEEGLRVLMPGAFGDELYCGEQDWLADLILDGRLRDAATEIRRHVRYAGLRGTLGLAAVRRVGRRLLNALPGGRNLRRNGNNFPVWLRSEAAARLEGQQDWLHPAFELKEDLLGIRTSQNSSYENFHASRHALELRHPYRDRRLVEYVLSLPAYQLYNLGFYKYILRTSMRGILPEPILSRTQPTSLSPLFLRGLERERGVLQTCLDDPDARWREIVRADWLLEYWNNGSPRQVDDASAVALWCCVSYDAWLRDFS